MTVAPVVAVDAAPAAAIERRLRSAFLLDPSFRAPGTPAEARAALTRAWTRLRARWGVGPAEFWAVHRAGDPLNCVALAPDAARAAAIARAWAGPAVEVSHVRGDPEPERWVALPVALLAAACHNARARVHANSSVNDHSAPLRSTREPS